jgi:Zn-dependent protease with chaperone function
MFVARCIGVSLALFTLVYVVISLAASHGWRWVLRLCRAGSSRDAANLLFTLRMMPFLVASLFTLAFTLPSFLLLEPRSTGENVGTAPAILALICLTFLAAGIVRALSVLHKTSRALENWLEGSRVISQSPVPVIQTAKSAPALTVAGLRDAKVLVSEAAAAALSPAELETALRHEMAHVRAHDNLKKLLFRLALFPGMRKLEQAWTEKAELAADDAAVGSLGDALDLAAALIKVSRLKVAAPVALTTGLLHSSTALSQRIQRLVSWQLSGTAGRRGRKWMLALPTTMAVVMLLVTTYGSALAQLHAVTEWLVR